MDKDLFIKILAVAKNTQDHAKYQEYRMHTFDFFDYFETYGPLVFTDVELELFKEPTYRTIMWKEFLHAMTLLNVAEPIDRIDNIISFESARLKRLA